jgi:cytochrome b6-f complex iron-sulfur subunit
VGRIRGASAARTVEVDAGTARKREATAMVNEPLVPTPPISSWQAALAARSNRGAASTSSAAASRAMPGVTRRRFILGTFLATLGVSMGGAVATLLDFLYPRGVTRPGGPFPAGNVADYERGAPPVLHDRGHFFLVNLDPADTAANGSGGGEGLLALSRKCPHLGCSVPWTAGFEFMESQGWFRCPCHQSTYTKAGLRVLGQAPRPMDTFRVEVTADGTVIVHTDEITRGADDNPRRAVRA